MTSKSKSKPWRELKERRRMFMHLAFHIFEAYTNIRDLIIEDYMEKHMENHKRNPLNIKEMTEHYFNKMRRGLDWSTSILKRLDFILPPGKREKHASIWDKRKANRDTIYQRGLLYHKRMIYLPLHILATATNAEQLLLDEAKKRNHTKLENIDYWIKEMHGQLHLVECWQKFMKKLAFKKKEDIVLNDIQEPVVVSTLRQSNLTQSASSSGNNAQVAPVPSTSRDGPSTWSKMVGRINDIVSNKPNQNRKRVMELQNVSNETDQGRSSKAIRSLENDHAQLPKQAKLKIRADIWESNTAIEGASTVKSHCSEKEQASVNQNQSTEQPSVSYIQDHEIFPLVPDQISSIGTSQERLPEQTVEARNTNLSSRVDVAVVPSKQSTSNGKIDKSAGINLENTIPEWFKPTEATEIQKRVMEIDNETFVNQTNISEHAKQSKETRELIQTIVDGVMRKCYEMRTDSEHWKKGLLKSLKLKETRTDDQDVQLDPMDRNSNEIYVVKTGQTNTPPSLQAKMAKLSIHEIKTSQIIHFQFVEVTSSQDNATITDDDAYITNVQSSLAVMDERIFVACQKCIEHTPQQTEPQSAQNPIGSLAAPEDMIDHEEEILGLEICPILYVN